MTIKQAIFAGSCTNVAAKPARKLPEFAFIGRSNVGKSSLINLLCDNRKLAKTSSTPGKTQLINHFLINDRWYLVDLPGYGYARMSQEGRDRLRRMIEGYISQSEELVVLFVLVDCRHDIGKIDRDFIHRLGENSIPFAILFTKCDKLGPNALKAQIERDKELLLQDWEELPPMFTSSAQDGSGKKEILDYIEQYI